MDTSDDEADNLPDGPDGHDGRAVPRARTFDDVLGAGPPGTRPRSPQGQPTGADRAARPSKPSLRDQARAAPVTFGLAAAIVALLLLVEATGGVTGANMYRWGAQPVPLPPGEWWRLFTSMFLHFGLLHLAFNLWALWIFGPLLERMVGSSRFAALYLASGLAGSAASALFVTPPALGAGASGAIFGLLGAFGVVGFRLRATPAGQAWLKQALVLLGLNVLIGLSNPSIGLAAHLGGLVGGVLVMLSQTAGRTEERTIITPEGRTAQVAVPPDLRRWSGFAAAAIVAVAALWLPLR